MIEKGSKYEYLCIKCRKKKMKKKCYFKYVHNKNILNKKEEKNCEKQKWFLDLQNNIFNRYIL